MEACYRYTLTGNYYDRIRINYKEVHRSLGTRDRATAQRKPGDLRRDLDRTGVRLKRLTIGKLCDRYLATIRNQSAKTVKRQTAIAAAIRRD